MTAHTTRIGFVGLGNMGYGMATQLASKGFQVTGYDLRAQVVQDLAAKTGAKAASSQHDACHDQAALIVMTQNIDQARMVLLGESSDGGSSDNPISALQKDAVIILMSTVSPQDSRALAEQINKIRPDLGFIDAPVSGGSPGANSGTLTIMASGSPSHFTKVKAVLEAMGDKVHHVGHEVGQGQSMKAINQVLCGVHLVAAAEALSMAKASGIDPALALGVVRNSAAGSWMLSNRAQRMLEEEPQCASSVATWSKDMGIVMDVARGQHVHAPLAAVAAQQFNAAMARGLKDEDDTTLIRQYDFLNGNDRR
ncbi:hypothetical protein BDZ90DRAFT_257143 [Jaminaea rosea]|uniref:3-hydroxyisobutyrate dehydrogenase n=1 Tax=Jaminaea rosea TaxID=1569628 RepID=A0A316UXK1_9BASI|nr:hypothetical protein BDZ90DRAFT_257143 [Jaminaea rosea]PWN30040.1 hypothetical protein BDZ90DRAFT_257143 [Jaminaea rosea]